MKRFALAILFALIPTLLQAAVVDWGDYDDADQTIYLYFNTVGSTGVPVTLVGEGVEIYEDGSATQITSATAPGAATLDDDWDGVAGFHQLAINLADVGFDDGKTYTAIMAPGSTADGVSVAGQIVGTFSVGRYASTADISALTGGGIVSDSGTAQSGTSTTIRLRAAASAVDDYYNYSLVTITAGPGAGQTRVISNYVGSNTTATVSEAWATGSNPTLASEYSVLPAANIMANAEVVLTTAAIDAISADILASTNGAATVGAQLQFLTGDAFARLGDPVSAANTIVGDIAAISVSSGSAAILSTTVATRTSDTSFTLSANHGAGNLVGTVISLTNAGGTYLGRVNTNATAAAITVTWYNATPTVSASGDVVKFYPPVGLPTNVIDANAIASGAIVNGTEATGFTNTAAILSTTVTSKTNDNQFSIAANLGATNLVDTTISLTNFVGTYFGRVITNPGATEVTVTWYGTTPTLNVSGDTVRFYAPVSWNTAWDAEVQSEAADALIAVNLDQWMGAAGGTGDVVTGSWLARLISKTVTNPVATSYDNTTDSMEAMRDNQQPAADAAIVANELDHLLKSPYSPTIKPGHADALLNKLVQDTPTVTGTPQLTANALAQSQVAADAALVNLNLDHWMKVAGLTTDIADNSWLAKLISKSATAASTSYNNTTDSLEAIRDNQVTPPTPPTPAAIATAVWTEALPGTYTTDQAGGLLGEIGTDGAGLTGVPWNTAWADNIEAECDQALKALELDYLLSTTYNAAAKPGDANGLLNKLMENAGGTPGVPRYTAAALFNAPAGGTGTETTSHTGLAQASTGTTIKLQTGASTIDNYYTYQIVALTGGVGGGQSAIISGYDGDTLIATINGTWAAGSIPDGTTTTYKIFPFGAVPGATAPTTEQIWGYPTATAATLSGSMGRLLTDNVNATIGSRAPETGGNIVSIKTKTDYLPSATAGNASGLLIAGSNAATTFATFTVTNAHTVGSSVIGTTANAAQTGDSWTKTQYLPSATAGNDGGVLIAGNNAATTFATLTSTGVFKISGVNNISQTGDSYGVVNSGTHGNAAIKGFVDDIGVAGQGLTQAPWNTEWNDDVEAEVDDALRALSLDFLFASDYEPASKPGIPAGLLNVLVQDDGTSGVPQFTVNALENGPSGTGASAETIANAVWEEAKSEHTNANTYGDYLDSKVSAAGGTATLDPQQVRDAMLLPPTPATPIGAGSIDAKLNAIPTTTTLDPQAVRNALCLAPTAPSVAAGSIDALLSDIPATAAFPANFVDLAIAPTTGQVTADAEVVLTEEDLDSITDAVTDAAGVAQVHNQAPVSAFTSKLGTRRDGVVVASPTQRIVPGEIAHIWIDCSSVVGGNIANASNEASTNANVVVSAIGVYGKYVSMYVDATAASDGDKTSITCNVNPVGTQVIKVSLAIEVDDD